MRMVLALFVLVSMLFANLSLASPDFSLAMDDSISVKAGESGYLDLRITSSSSDNFYIVPVVEKSWMNLQYSKVFITAGQSSLTRITFSPPTIISHSSCTASDFSTYKFTFNVTSLTAGESRTIDTFVTVVRNRLLEFDKVAVTGSLEPSGMARIEIYVRNYGKDSADALVSANITSPTGRKVYELHDLLTLGAGERKAVAKDFYLGDCAEAGEYDAQLSLSYKNSVVDRFVQKFDVMKEPRIKIESSETGFVTYEKRYDIKNMGNDMGATVVRNSIFGSVFYSGSMPDSTANGVYEWNVELGPCEQRIILYKMDFSPVVIIIVALLAIWYVLFKFRTLRIRKLILQEKKIEEGSEFTVGIDLKAYMNAKDVVIRDFVPSAFDVKEAKGVKPEKTKTGAGTELVWRIDEFKRNEERILDYKIVPIFGVRGRVKLPAATASFNYFGRKIAKKSPPVRIGVHYKEPALQKQEEYRKVKLAQKKERPYPKYRRFTLPKIKNRKKEVEVAEEVEEDNQAEDRK